MRRLPVYILIDTSGSMKGEPIESVKVGLESMLSSLRQDPFALESAWISIIRFDSKAEVVVPLTSIEEFQMPDIKLPDSGATHTGAALELLCHQIDSEVRTTTGEVKGDWMPLLFIMTDGKPADLMVYNQMTREIRKRKFGTIVACAAGMKAKTEPLLQLTDNVYKLDNLDGATFKQFFKWVSDTIGVGNKSIGATSSLELPPPPPEVNIVI